MTTGTESHKINKRFFYNSLTLLIGTLLYFVTLENTFAQESVMYISPGTHTYKVPEGVYEIRVEAWGGGGAGGGVDKKSAAGGGAGGSYSSSTFNVIPGTIYTVFVGKGGEGSIPIGKYANSGEASSISIENSIIVLASGGDGALNITKANTSGQGAKGSSSNSIGDIIYKGGDGSAGNYYNPQYGGAGGGGAGSSGNGNNAIADVGGLAKENYGGRGANSPAINGDGLTGESYGGGGSGANSNVNQNRAGGSGANGLVIITPTTIQCANKWTGAVDNNWNNSKNWSCNVPTAEENAIIPSGLTSYPIISNGNTGAAKDLIIEQAASVIVSHGVIRLSGNVINNGTLDCKSGSIEFNGNTAQVIDGGSFIDNTIDGLKINNPSGVTIQGKLNVTGIVSIILGNLYSSNNLILKSDEKKTAMIDGSGTGELIGEVTIERYLPSAYGYKYYSSPFRNMTVGQFADDVDLISSFASFWKYDESNENTGWERYTDPQLPLDQGVGYAINFGSIGGEKTISGSGIVNNGQIGPISLYNSHREFTKGFNLIGNPYPSPIDWDVDGWIKENIDDAIYYFDASTSDPYAGTYSSYINGISSDGMATSIIPAQQGFFVHVNDAATEGSLTFNNDVRVAFLNPFYHKKAKPEYPVIRLKAGFEHTNTVADYLVLYFKPDASESIDAKADALKILNTDTSVPSLYYSTENGDKSSIKSLELHDDFQIIPLGISASAKGRIRISLNDFSGFDNQYIYLKDNYTGRIISLSSNESYSFDIDNEVIINRFVLILSKEVIEEDAFGSVSFNAYCENGSIHVRIDGLYEQVNTQLSDMTGRVIYYKDINGKGTHVLGNIPYDGIGIITMRTNQGTVSKKILLKR